jgi:anionic cell wall polymer biosynthesis LytR-Cps2A-Psr (LCP) family protein
MRSSVRYALAILAIVLPVLEGCTSSTSESEATGGTESAVTVGHTISFDDFAKTVADNEMSEDTGADCSFASTKSSDGLEITMIGDDKTTVTLSIPRDARITVKTKNEQATYTIAGVGSVEILNADDAFNRVTVSSKSKSAACEVDF